MKKYTVQAFIMMMLCITIVSCSSELDQPNNAAALNRITFDIVEEGGGSSRAITSASMKTTFETGDMAGVFAVKDGKILEGINNMPLTYNQYGAWEPATAIVYDKEKFQGVQFFAYYPYSETATIDAAQADPFSQMVADHPLSLEQGDKQSYNANDLMTTPGAKVDEAALNTVRLSMRHRMALVCVELPNASYVFPGQDIDAYVLSKASGEKFYLGDKPVTPFRDDATQQYRLLVKPSTPESLNIGYTDNLGVRDTFQTASLSRLQSGQCTQYFVNGGVILKEWNLQVGDYYCADGRLLSKDATAEEIAQKGDVIGVVFKIGTPTTVKQFNLSLPQGEGGALSHAEVLALSTYSGKAAWGVSKAAGTTNWKTWYTRFGMTAPSTTTVNGQKIPNDTEANLQEVGLPYTMSWLSIPSDLTMDNVQQDYVSEFKNVYAAWTADNALPAGLATPWYVPSLREWLSIKSQTAVLEAQFAKAGGSVLWQDDFSWGTQIATGSNMGYWTCSVRSEDIAWQFTGLGTAEHPEYDYSAVKVSAAKMYYRFMFAF